MTDSLVALIRAELARAADPELAPGMQAYMKSALPYYGVRVPRVRTLTRAAARQLPPADLAELADAAAEGRASWRWYAPGLDPGSLVVDAAAFAREKAPLARLIQIMLRRTADRPGRFDCFGLH